MAVKSRKQLTRILFLIATFMVTGMVGARLLQRQELLQRQVPRHSAIPAGTSILEPLPVTLEANQAPAGDDQEVNVNRPGQAVDIRKFAVPNKYTVFEFFSPY